MVVTAVVDTPAVLLLDALDAVRTQPAPAGQVPSRLAALSHAQAQLRGVYLRELAAAEAAGEPAAHGCRSAADLLVDTAGLPAWQARKDAALARRLALVPGLLDALAEGGLELDAALLLVRAWSALPPALRDAATAEALVLLAGLVDLADLKAKVDELVGALQPEVTDESVAAARESGGLVLTDVGAETRLSGTTDVLTGEWLREVLEAKAEADRGLQDGRDGDARLLDALLDIVRAGMGTGAVPGGSTADGGAPLLVVVATPDDLVAAADAATGPAPVRVDPADALDELLAPVTPTRPRPTCRRTTGPPASLPVPGPVPAAGRPAAAAVTPSAPGRSSGSAAGHC